MTADQADTAIK